MSADYKTTFKEYVDNKVHEKFALLITKEQVAMCTGFDDHAMLMKEIFNKVRPDVITDVWGNPIDDSNVFDDDIKGFGWPGNAYFFMPDNGSITTEQFEEIKSIVTFVEDYNIEGHNFHIEVNDFENRDLMYNNDKDNTEEFLSKLENYVKPLPEDYVEKEVVIGKHLIGMAKAK